MKAYVTVVSEPTLELCKWSLQRNGFETAVIKSDSNLWSKLNTIYQTEKNDFLRVDADTIVNQYMTPEFLHRLTESNDEIWWWQFQVFDWYKQDIGHSMAFIRKQALPSLKKNIGRFQRSLRPETEISRIAELNDPRRMLTYQDRIMGLHGYGIEDLEPVKKLKKARAQYEYDFELAERLNKI